MYLLFVFYVFLRNSVTEGSEASSYPLMTSSTPSDSRATGSRKKNKFSQFLSKWWRRLRRAKLWMTDTYTTIKQTHEEDVQARREWAKQLEEIVWFPPREDEVLARETEIVFGEFQIFFQSKRHTKDESAQSVPVLNMGYGNQSPRISR